MQKTGAACLTITVIIISIILATVLMGVSIKIVDYRTAAILINSITKQIDQATVYLPGR